MAKEPETSVKQQPQDKWRWLLSPVSVLQHPPGELFQDAVVFVVLLLATALLNAYLAFVNVSFLFVRWGSLVLLVLAAATILYLLKLIAHLAHGIALLKKQYKAALFVIIVLLALYAYVRREAIVPWLLRQLARVPWNNLNPLAVYFA